MQEFVNVPAQHGSAISVVLVRTNFGECHHGYNTDGNHVIL